MFQYRPSRSHCCFGCHNHSFVFATSLFYIVCSVLLLVATIVSGFAIISIFPLVTLALSVLVLWGNRYYIPCLYLPALLLEILVTFLFVLASLSVIAYGCYIIYIHYEDYSVEREQKESIVTIGMGIGTIFTGLLCLSISVIHSYFVEIFWRDYLFMRDRNAACENDLFTMRQFSKYM